MGYYVVVKWFFALLIGIGEFFKGVSGFIFMHIISGSVWSMRPTLGDFLLV